MDGADREKMLETWERFREDREAEFRRYRFAREGFNAKPISRSIDRQMADLGLNERMIEDQLIQAWETVVGPANASQSRPVQLQRGLLIIAVMQPALMYELERFHKTEILRRLQERFGKAAIRGIRFRVGN